MAGCHEVREVLEEYRRGELTADAARSVEAHLAECPACRALRERDDALAALIRTLPVTPASAALRRRVLEADRLPTALGRWLRHPAVSALAAAVLVAVALSPWLQLRRGGAPDPVQSLIAAGVSEHRRILLQLQDDPGAIADAATAFARVYARTDIALPRAFAGDQDLRLVAARPTLLVNRKAAAAVLRQGSVSITTYFAVPGTDLPMPAEGRVQIEQYRPYMRQVNGFHAIYWKQGELAYLMISDLDNLGSRQLYLRMRRAL